MSYHMISHDRHGKIVHRSGSNCISSIENLMGTLLSSLCQLLNKGQLALFWLGVQLSYNQMSHKRLNYPLCLLYSIQTKAIVQQRGDTQSCQRQVYWLQFRDSSSGCPVFRVNDFMFYKDSSYSNHKKRCFRIGCLNVTIISLSHKNKVRLKRSKMGRGTRVQELFIIIRAVLLKGCNSSQ